jgi:hypothetical protein
MTWTGAQRIRAILFVAIAAAMILVPAVRLIDGGARFGWRMYSFLEPLPKLTLVDERGTPSEIDPVPFIGRLRGDVPFASALPPHLCEVVSGTARVVIELSDDRFEFVCP